MVVVRNYRHNSSPTAHRSRSRDWTGGMCVGGTGLSLPPRVTLAKLLSLSGPVFPLVKGKREKGEF